MHHQCPQGVDHGGVTHEKGHQRGITVGHPARIHSCKKMNDARVALPHTLFTYVPLRVDYGGVIREQVHQRSISVGHRGRIHSCKRRMTRPALCLIRCRRIFHYA